jgi:hypothetical protein
VERDISAGDPTVVWIAGSVGWFRATAWSGRLGEDVSMEALQRGSPDWKDDDSNRDTSGADVA